MSSSAVLVSLLVASCTPHSSLSVLGSSPVSAGNNGSGRVVSEPPGVDCTLTSGAMTGSCSASFADHAVVTLTATSTDGSTFAGWSNLASGTDFDYEQTLGFQHGVATANPLPLDVGADRALVVLASFVVP